MRSLRNIIRFLKNGFKFFFHIFSWAANLENSINYNGELHLTLRELIDLKSRRDGKIFTIYQLAKAINMPHSILIKLTHQDPTKRVNNPRIDTLTKIIDFFKSDGFAVTIDSLFTGHNETDIQSQSIITNDIEKIIQVFSLNNDQTKIGTINIEISSEHKNIIAFLSDNDVNPFFKAGSIFIIDREVAPCDNNLIAAKLENHSHILIKKLLICGHKKYLVSLDNNNDKIQLLPTTHCTIIGVIVRVNAKT